MIRVTLLCCKPPIAFSPLPYTIFMAHRCSATNRLIVSNDKAAVQVNIAHVNPDGVYMGDYTTMAICGFVRKMGESDGFLDRLWTKCYEEHNSAI